MSGLLRHWQRTVDADENIHDELVEIDLPFPEPAARAIEASLLTLGDLIVLPEYVAGAGEQARVGRAFPFQGGASIELVDGTTVVLFDDQPVTLLATGAEQAVAW